MEKQTISIDELKARMEAKLAAIPTPKLSKKQLKKVQEKIGKKDEENLKHTLKILEERRKEAEKEGDQKKKFVSIAIERSERDKFNIRNQIREIEAKMDALSKAFDKNTWDLLYNFSELKDPDFWERAKKEGNYTDKDIDLYYKDVWGFDPKTIVKFLEILKLNRKKRELEKLL